MTDCTSSQMKFKGFGRRRVVGAFDGGRITSDGGVLLVREVAEGSGLIGKFASCFTDHRDAALIEHTVESLIAQRVLGLACGYEDLNDHDTLRDDPLLAVAAGKSDPLGEHRARRRPKHPWVGTWAEDQVRRRRCPRSPADVWPGKVESIPLADPILEEKRAHTAAPSWNIASLRLMSTAIRAFPSAHQHKVSWINGAACEGLPGP